MALTTPQQQAGILGFYDAPEHGPKINAKMVLFAVALFTLFVILLDHLSAL